MSENTTTNTPKDNSNIEFSDIPFSYIKSFLNNNLFKYFSKNTSSKIAIITSLIAFSSFFMKVASHLYLLGYLSVYHISIKSIDYSTTQNFSDILFGAILMLGSTTIILLFYSVINNTFSILTKTKAKLKRINLKSIIFALFYIAILMILIIPLVGSINILLEIYLSPTNIFLDRGIKNIFIYILKCTALEFILSLEIFIGIKATTWLKRKTVILYSLQKNKLPLNRLLIIPTFIIFLTLTTFYIFGVSTSYHKKTLPLIGSDRAVVFQDKNYYWTVNANIEKNILNLDTTDQLAIDIKDTQINYLTFDKIKIH